MNRIIQILTFTLYTTLCFSQNDTIYLHQNYILLGTEKLNIVKNGGSKTGKWVDYEWVFRNDSIIEVNGASTIYFDTSIYEASTSHIPVRINRVYHVEYRPLKEGEYERIRILQSEKTDTIKNRLYYKQKYKEVRSKIPPDLYRIKGIGNYKNNLKHGAWEYFYRTGESKKKIIYENGIPKCDFNTYRENGTLMIRFVKVNDSVWEVSKYNENEVVFETIRDKLENFNGLY